MEENLPQGAFQNPNVASSQEPTTPVQTQMQSGTDPSSPSPVPPPSSSKKKLLVISLAFFGFIIVILGAALALKGRSGNGSTNQTSGPVELTWWGFNLSEQSVQPLIDEFMSQNEGVTIIYKKQNGENYRERLVSFLAQGAEPDIFEMHSSWYPMFVNNVSYLPESVMTINDYKSTFYPVSFSALGTNRGIVGIPVEYDGLALFVNDTILTTFAKTPPKSWDQLKEFAKAMTIIDSRQQVIQGGVALGVSSNVDYWQDILGLMIFQNGGNPGDPTNERTIRAIDYYKSFAGENVWSPNLPNSTNAFANNRLAMFFAPVSAVNDIKSINPNLDFSVYPVPQLPKDPSDPDTTYASFWAYGVSVKSKATETAWKFLKFISEKENIAIIRASELSRKGYSPLPSRQDMREELLTDRYYGAFLELAPWAQTWYLASNTSDGETGINTQISSAYEVALGRSSSDFKNSLTTVLGAYGLQ